jgi:transposase
MTHYVGLDVSMEVTSVCVVDGAGEIVWRGVCASNPEAMAAAVAARAGDAARVVLESGPMSHWHWHGLRALGVPVLCVDARHAHKFLSARLNKTDANDAEGLAQLARFGWFAPVRVKSASAHHDRALLAARQQLVKMRRDVENQVRGLLKPFGLLMGKVSGRVYETRVEELLGEAPALAVALGPLLKVRRALLREYAVLHQELLAIVKGSTVCQLLMSFPGIGPVTALAYRAAVDEPARFAKSSSVGAYFGLTSRRYQSGEVDWSGRISKCGDTMVRSLLYEAANALLSRVKKSCELKSWGLRLQKRVGARKAKVAVARRMAVILHRMWLDGTAFRYGPETALAAPADVARAAAA